MISLMDLPRKKMIWIVFSIILLQLITSAVFMAFEKNGYFPDDLYSYGFANSPGTVTPIEIGGMINTNNWMDGNIIRDFLTVSAEERFTFRRIMDTTKKDAHPPLFYWLLHFVCSLTPGIFSRWSGFAVNAAGFIIIQIYLYRLSLFISEDRFISLLTMTFFGFTSASINMMSLIRMYVLGLGFTMAFTFYAMRYTYSSQRKKYFDTDDLMAFVMLYLSSMTVYISILFAFFITLFVCATLMLKKKIGRMLAFGISMLAAIGVMVLSFPILFEQLGHDQTAMKGAELYPYFLQLRTGIHVILNGLFGIKTPIFPSMIPFYIFWSLIGTVIIYCIMLFLFRKDEWFGNFRKRIRSCTRETVLRIFPYLKTLFPIFLACVVILLIFSRRLMLYYYRYTGMRYLYMLTPFIAMTICIIVFKIIRRTPVRIVLVVAAIVASVVFGDKCFLEKEYRTKDLSKLTEGADVVVVENQHVIFMYHLADLFGCNEYMYSNQKSIAEKVPFDEIIRKSKNSHNMMLMLDVNACSLDEEQTRKVDTGTGLEIYDKSSENDVIKRFREYPEFKDAEYLGEYGICYLYRLK